MIKTGTDETSFCFFAGYRLAQSASSTAVSSRITERCVRGAGNSKFYVCSLRPNPWKKSTPTVALWANNRDTLRQEWEIFRTTGAAAPTACKLLRKASLQPDIETNYSQTKLNPNATPFHPALPLQSTSCKSSLQPYIETNYSKTKLNPDAAPFHPALPLQSTACSSTLNPLAEIVVPK